MTHFAFRDLRAMYQTPIEVCSDKVIMERAKIALGVIDRQLKVDETKLRQQNTSALQEVIALVAQEMMAKALT